MRITVVSQLAIVVMVFAAGFVAGAQGKDHTRINVTPAAAGAAPRPYTQAVMAGDTLYLSGNIGSDPATGKPPAVFADAVQQALSNQTALLKAAGLTWADVVKVNVYVKDISKYGEFNAIYVRELPAPLPARTFLQVADLPGGGQVEIEAIAVRRR